MSLQQLHFGDDDFPSFSEQPAVNNAVANVSTVDNRAEDLMDITETMADRPQMVINKFFLLNIVYRKNLFA